MRTLSAVLSPNPTKLSTLLAGMTQQQMTQAFNILTLINNMSVPSITIISRDINNNETQTDLPLTGAGNFMFAVDANNNITLAAAPGAALQQHAGSVTCLATDTSKTITFATPMSDANYEVSFQMNGLAGLAKSSNLTAQGFTMNIAAAIVGTIGWNAIHNG